MSIVNEAVDGGAIVTLKFVLRLCQIDGMEVLDIEKQVVEELAKLGEDICTICHESPMTVNCNNAGCDV